MAAVKRDTRRSIVEREEAFGRAALRDAAAAGHAYLAAKEENAAAVRSTLAQIATMKRSSVEREEALGRAALRAAAAGHAYLAAKEENAAAWLSTLAQIATMERSSVEREEALGRAAVRVDAAAGHRVFREYREVVGECRLAMKAWEEKNAAAWWSMQRQIATMERSNVEGDEALGRAAVRDAAAAGHAELAAEYAALKKKLKPRGVSVAPQQGHQSGMKRPRTPSAAADRPVTPSKQAPLAPRRTSASRSKARGASGSKEASQPRKRMLSTSNVRRRSTSKHAATQGDTRGLHGLLGGDAAPSAVSDISSLFRDPHQAHAQERESAAGNSARTVKSRTADSSLFFDLGL